MRRQMLSLFLTLLILISIGEAVSVVGTASYIASGQALKPTIKAKADSYPFPADPRIGVCHSDCQSPTPALVPAPTPTPPILIPTTLLIQEPQTAVHVGDRITITGTLSHSETMNGIAGAPITIKLSLDGKNWVTIDNKKTDSNGSICYTITVPDPRSYGQKLPVVLGYKFSYDGSDTYLASDAVCNITVVT